MPNRHNKCTKDVGCPYTWKGVPIVAGAPLGRGKEVHHNGKKGVILSPMKVPPGLCRRFEFEPCVDGWPAHAIDLLPGESLEYAMVREGNTNPVERGVHTIAVRVGKRGIDGSLIQVTWLLPDENGGRKIDLNSINYEDLERAGLVKGDA